MLDQIKNLRKQLDEDELAFAAGAHWSGASRGDMGGRGGGGGGGASRSMPHLSVVEDAYGQDGLPQFIEFEEAEEEPIDEDSAAPVLLFQNAQ